jgi:hypothetical protein
MRAAIIAAAACCALAMTGCSGGASSPRVAELGSAVSSPASSGTSSGPASSLAHAECMRTHGVPDFPDPGLIQINVKDHPDLDPSSPAFVTAQKACISLAGGTAGNGVTPAMQLAALAYSACMRTHGFPNFPDPVFDSRGEHVAINGIDTDSAQFQNADKTCQTSSGLAAQASAAGNGP